jgi:hypothetical protein
MSYRLFVSKDRCVMVTMWDDGKVEVAMRAHPSEVWGPPRPLLEEPGE